MIGKTILIGIARMGSSRLPGKVMMKLGGVPVLDWVVNAGWNTSGVDEVWIATSTDPRDDVIQEWCEKSDVQCFRGSETDVLTRFTGAAIAAKADIAVRVTCDCPFLDSNVIGEVIALRAATGADYASNNDPPSWPDGLDCEAVKISALIDAGTEATRPSDRECVTQFIVRNRHRFTAVSLPCPIPGLHKERWVLDTEKDYELCQKIAEYSAPGTNSYLGIHNLLNKFPEWRKINADHPRNERFFESLPAEEPLPRPHTISKAMLAKAREVIPLGTQTFSKSYLQYPTEAPLFVTHGNGGLVYDVDGNDYVDLVSGLLPNILGYRDPDVDFAIRSQLAAGISFSLATPMEAELAETLKEIIPCAEMSRFGKNGTDVTSAAVRLARYVTSRNGILTSGYHGWADWSVAHDLMRRGGVPSELGDFTTQLSYGDLEQATQRLKSRTYACVIVEPETDPGFLSGLRRLCDETDTILIFDEIITGFRMSLGGAQKYWGVTPDLATFGKAMANGMPISALVGKAQYMKEMEKVCFSGTFFGETLSLAAALATIKKMRAEHVLDYIRVKNAVMKDFVADLKLDWLSLSGEGLQRINFHNISIYNFSKETIKTLFIQEMIANGVLVIASHNFCYAHNDADMERIKNAYQKTAQIIERGRKEGNLTELILGQTISASANVRAAS